jgi:asparagine N-glycosylation enzyme membrane subunit Stt3
MNLRVWFGKIKKHTEVGYLLVFLVSAVFFGYLQAQPTFADPDSFYHTRLVQLTLSQGPVREFPWLPLTVLADGYADHHFLYHLLLIPFFLAFGPLVGMKVATALLAAGAITGFYGLLRTFGFNRFSLIPTILLATSGGFLLRLNLAKTPAIAMLWLFLELIAIRKRRPGWLALLAFGHVWLHGSWPLLPVVLTLYLLAEWVATTDWKQGAHGWWSAWRQLWPQWWRLGAAVAGGLATGLVINPFFPGNLSFYWEQIYQIAVINYQDQLPVGMEWWPLSPARLIGQAPALVIMALVTLGGFILIGWSALHRVRLKSDQMTGLLFAGGWLVVTTVLALRQHRQVEYYSPALALLAALLLGLLLTVSNFRQVQDRLKWAGGGLIANRCLLIGLGTATWLLLTIFTVVHVQAVINGFAWDRYRPAATWLEANAPPASLVVNLHWDDFPPLFYHSDRIRWYSGLDPTFSYRANPVLWRQLDAIRRNDTPLPPSAVLAAIDSAYYLLPRRGGQWTNFSHDPKLKLSYHDEEAIIYELKP